MKPGAQGCFAIFVFVTRYELPDGDHRATADPSGAGFALGSDFAVIGVFACKEKLAAGACSAGGRRVVAIQPCGVPAGGGAFADAVRARKKQRVRGQLRQGLLGVFVTDDGERAKGEGHGC